MKIQISVAQTAARLITRLLGPRFAIDVYLFGHAFCPRQANQTIA